MQCQKLFITWSPTNRCRSHAYRTSSSVSVCIANADRVRFLCRDISASAMCSEKTLIASLLASEATGRVSWNVRARLTHPLRPAADYIEMTYDSRMRPRSSKQDIRLDFDVFVLLADVSCMLWLSSTFVNTSAASVVCDDKVVLLPAGSTFGLSIQLHR